jgi:hypothetical protein
VRGGVDRANWLDLERRRNIFCVLNLPPRTWTARMVSGALNLRNTARWGSLWPRLPRRRVPGSMITEMRPHCSGEVHARAVQAADMRTWIQIKPLPPAGLPRVQRQSSEYVWPSMCSSAAIGKSQNRLNCRADGDADPLVTTQLR